MLNLWGSLLWLEILRSEKRDERNTLWSGNSLRPLKVLRARPYARRQLSQWSFHNSKQHPVRARGDSVPHFKLNIIFSQRNGRFPCGGGKGDAVVKPATRLIMTSATSIMTSSVRGHSSPNLTHREHQLCSLLKKATVRPQFYDNCIRRLKYHFPPQETSGLLKCQFSSLTCLLATAAVFQSSRWETQCGSI